MRTRNILFLTEGGEEFGYGHLTRCIALSQAFKEVSSKEKRMKVNCRFIVHCDRASYDYIKSQRVQIQRADWKRYYKRYLQDIADADYVIIDSYKASFEIYEYFYSCRQEKYFSSPIGNRLVIIDDYNRITYPPSVIVNPIPGIRASFYRTSKHVRQKSNNLYMAGESYTILRKPFWRVPAKRIRKNIKNIFITFGGSSHARLMNQTAKALSRVFDAKIQTMDVRKNRVTASQMVRFMQSADICVSGGGQTLFELARLGVPIVCVKLANNQNMNIRYFMKKKLLLLTGSPESRNLIGNIIDMAKKCASYRYRAHCQNKSRQAIDGLGAVRTVTRLLDNSRQMRAALN